MVTHGYFNSKKTKLPARTKTFPAPSPDVPTLQAQAQQVRNARPICWTNYQLRSSAAEVDVQLRPLSREESLRRSASAVSFFKVGQLGMAKSGPLDPVSCVPGAVL
jgi:hypothetical protein